MGYFVDSFKAMKGMIFGEDINFLAILPALVIIMGVLVAIRIAMAVFIGW